METPHCTDDTFSLVLSLTENMISLSDASAGIFSKISWVGHSKLKAFSATCPPHIGSFFRVNLGPNSSVVVYKLVKPYMKACSCACYSSINSSIFWWAFSASLFLLSRFWAHLASSFLSNYSKSR